MVPHAEGSLARLLAADQSGHAPRPGAAPPARRQLDLAGAGHLLVHFVRVHFECHPLTSTPRPERTSLLAELCCGVVLWCGVAVTRFSHSRSALLRARHATQTHTRWERRVELEEQQRRPHRPPRGRRRRAAPGPATDARTTSSSEPSTERKRISKTKPTQKEKTLKNQKAKTKYKVHSTRRARARASRHR